MSKRVNVFADDDMVEVIYAGMVTAGELAEDRALGEKMCSMDGLRKVLIDCTGIDHPLATLPLFSHGTGLAVLPTLKRIKHALVVHKEIVGDAHFFETILSNRGVEMRYFTSRADALAWLNESSDKTLDKKH